MENIKPTFETPTEEDFNATKADEQALNKSQNLRKAGLLATGLVRFGMAMAGGTEDPDQKLNDTFHEEFSKNNIEATSQLQTEPIPDATTGFYSENLSMYEPEPFVETEFESNDEMFSFKSNLSFQTDKAEIPPDGQEKITEGAHNFLASITPENFDQIINSEWNLMGSSDERPTNAWGEEGNEALTQARLNEMFDIFDKARDEYDFSKSGLTTEQIEELLTKKINLLMPEGGVTHVTDLINPKTGETFTEEEVENLKRNDKQQYALLLQQARFVAFNIEGEVEPVEKPQLAKEELPETNLEEEPVFAFEKVSTVDFIKGLEKYSSFTFALDNSESVEYGEMIKGIESYLSTNGDFFEKLDGVVPYSFDAELNNQKEPKNIQQLESMLERFENKPGSGYERITTAAQQILEILESLPINTPDEPRALILWTDEMAHDASKASSIVEEAKAKGYEVIFAMSNDATKEVAVLPAEEISRAYELNKDNLRPGQKMYVGIADFSYGESASNDAYKVILKQADSGNPVLASTN